VRIFAVVYITEILARVTLEELETGLISRHVLQSILALGYRGGKLRAHVFKLISAGGQRSDGNDIAYKRDHGDEQQHDAGHRTDDGDLALFFGHRGLRRGDR